MKKILLIIPLMVLASSISMLANVSLPTIFSNNMVLQQNSKITMWGWGKPYEKITITASWDTTVYKTITNNQATWETIISTPKAGGPYTIKVQGYNSIELSNILIGEVWLCSGQSNMEWSARLGIDNAQKEVEAANYPEIRFFSVTHRSAETPNYDVNGNWQICTPQSMIDFSAAAYFFARELQKELQVPIGIVNASWGGTPAEVWTPQSVIENDSILLQASKKIEEMAWSPREPGKVYNAMIAPITKFNIAGVIWYQGESNAANAETYDRLFSKLITSWRDAWNKDFPFYYAQIAPYTYGGESGVMIQNAQRKVLQLENTGMISTSDICNDVTNIHPTNKQDVGKRFANMALQNTYNKPILMSACPLYRSSKIDGSKIVVYFDNAQGLHSKTKEIEGFEIATTNGVFVKAEAKIIGNTIVVWSKNISTPSYVRYAWNNTYQPKICNNAGLPTSCFSTQK